MGLSRQARIMTLLVIDTAFFFLELTVGYWVGSLALVADSFHMLNDILSLIVALYTIKLATSPSSAENSYGWQRAEILGALINGVFLIALCTSIGLEALGRIISPPEISNPKLIVIVGSLGLLSNLVGLALFHDHGHAHGGHSHGPAEPRKSKKKTGPIALPEDEEEGEASPVPVPRARADSLSSLYQHPAETRAQIIQSAQSLGNEDSFLAMSPPVHARKSSVSALRRSKTSSSSRHRPSATLSHAPAPGTNETIAPSATTTSSETAVEDAAAVPPAAPSTEAPVGNHANSASDAERGVAAPNGHDHDHEDEDGHAHGGPGHSHGSMNMHGVFLHVLGDALGNIGVIAAGLVIWFCEGRWTLYFDPGVSLLITCIIFSSAMPLVKSASAILMQGVPQHVSLDDVRDAIKRVDGVVSVHELHVWQLSESTSVASVHVLILPGYDYMDVANNIRQVLHRKGIHSVTIQPEFSTASAAASDDGSELDERTCLIRCPPDQCVADTCCPPVSPNPAPTPTRTPQLSHVSEGDERSHHSGHSH